MKNEKIQIKDDKLLKNEKSWRRARVGVLFLAAIQLFVLYSIGRPHLDSEKELFGFAIGWFLFWIVLLDWLNMRLRHINSIKYYRDQLKGESGKK